MFIIGNLFSALAQVLDAVINVFYWLVILRALTSWVNPDPMNTIVIFLNRVTEPLVAPFRRLLPSPAGLDLSPLYAILFLIFTRAFLVQSLYTLAFQLR